MSLTNKVTLITGGTKNLGATIARLFASSGSHLALHYNSPATKSAASSLLKELPQSYPSLSIKLYQGDLTSSANVHQLFQSVLSDFNGRLDIVINTVGKVLKKPLVEISESEYDEMFAVNSKSAFLITQEAAKRVSDGGKIINTVTSLLAAYTGFYTAYQGSKSPVEWFTKGLSKELMGRKIAVNSVAPGPTDTRKYCRLRPQSCPRSY